MHEAALLEDAEHLLDVVPAELLRGGERQLERRALHVIDQDVQVVRIDQRVLGRRVEEVRRVADDELIERRAAGDEHRRRAAAAAAGAAGALPGGGDRARIAGHHADVERADVDPELQRVGRDDGAHAALAQSLLDLAPALRQVAAAIAADLIARARRAVEVVLEIRRQDLGRQPALREDDHLQLALQELARRRGAFRPDTTGGCRAAG